MPTLESIFFKTIERISEHLFPLMALFFCSTAFSQIPEIVLKQHPILGTLMILLVGLFNYLFTLSFTFEILSGNGFNFSAVYQRIYKKFIEYTWLAFAGSNMVLKNIFPYVYPSLFTSCQVWLTGPLFLFDEENDVKVFNKSAAMVMGDEWKLIGFFILIFALEIFSSLIGKSGFFSFVVNLGLSLFGYVFTIVLWQSRKSLLVVTPDQDRTTFKEKSMSTLPGAIGGLVYLMILVFVVLFVIALRFPSLIV